MTEIGLGHYLTLGAVIFSIGIIGIFLNRKNIIVILMSIELILLAVNIVCVNLAAKMVFLLRGIKPRSWLEKQKATQSMTTYLVIWILSLTILLVVILFRHGYFL